MKMLMGKGKHTVEVRSDSYPKLVGRLNDKVIKLSKYPINS